MLSKEQIDQMISTFTDHINDGKITPNHQPDCGYCRACQTAIDLAAEVDRLKAERRWIATSERLPEDCPDLHKYDETLMTVYSVWVYGKRKGGTFKTVGLANRLILRKSGIPFLEKLQQPDEYNWHWSTDWDVVTHWMPLPTPPKE